MALPPALLTTTAPSAGVPSFANTKLERTSDTDAPASRARPTEGLSCAGTERPRPSERSRARDAIDAGEEHGAGSPIWSLRGTSRTRGRESAPGPVSKLEARFDIVPPISARKTAEEP